MITIENPFMRIDLISFLESLSDYEHQKNCWVQGNCSIGIEDCFDMSVHFFFDDSGLAQNASGLLGYILYDENEVKLIANLCMTIKEILNKYGTNLTDDEYINKPEWVDVLQIAKSSLLVCVENDKNVKTP